MQKFAEAYQAQKHVRQPFKSNVFPTALKWSCSPIIIALLFLLLLSSPDVVFAPWRSSPRDKAPESHPVMNLAQKIFIVYTILVHLNTLLFTGRLSWALVHVLDQTSKVMKRRTDQYMSASEPSSPVAEVSTALDMKDAKRAATRLWVAEVAETVGEVTHAIILPNYKEDVDTLRCTLDVLASHPRARTQYEVYLAMEQKETSAADKAEGLVSSYGKSFALIQATFHPADVPSEIAGKSSNVAFAARHIGQVHQAELESGTCNVVITVMDADTNLWQDYFTEICRMHYMHPTTANRTLYSCPIIFDRNSNDSPVFVRCADLLWSFAGLSTMYPRSTVSIPTSVYSLPLALATNVGGWDSDPTSIGEDMHMMLKCYFRTNGNLVSRVIHAPASQCNVSSDLPRPGFRRTLDTCVARYRQALRHMWGALDSGFAARNTIREARLSWRSFLLKPRHLALMHLLWEAHFLPCHFTILLLFSIAYEQIAPSLNPWMIFTFQVTGLVRFLSFVAMNVNISLYNRWYKVCLQTRRNDAAQIPHGLDAGGFSDRSAWYSLPFLLERIAFPIAGTVFGAIPTVHAVFMHFATEKLAYRVSKKPAFGVASVV